MRKKTPNQAREELLRARDQLIQRRERIRADAAHRFAPLSADSSDRAQEQENDETLASLDRAVGELLAQYHHALERIDLGQYGTCEHCGRAIAARRLDVVPQATVCAACATTPAARAA
jgi:DnaK suppressor protein